METPPIQLRFGGLPMFPQWEIVQYRAFWRADFSTGRRAQFSGGFMEIPIPWGEFDFHFVKIIQKITHRAKTPSSNSFRIFPISNCFLDFKQSSPFLPRGRETSQLLAAQRKSGIVSGHCIESCSRPVSSSVK